MCSQFKSYLLANLHFPEFIVHTDLVKYRVCTQTNYFLYKFALEVKIILMLCTFGSD